MCDFMQIHNQGVSKQLKRSYQGFYENNNRERLQSHCQCLKQLYLNHYSVSPFLVTEAACKSLHFMRSSYKYPCNLVVTNTTYTMMVFTKDIIAYSVIDCPPSRCPPRTHVYPRYHPHPLKCLCMYWFLDSASLDFLYVDY